ncbi:hypothetical protein P1S61_24520 [Streptomyces sp. ME08-AFT2]|uniref:hypothetical protein n=1 Tax=Streptomyces sp. ME08-AFT2 TaxID=3028683 RepID=UPI0029AD2158|nr:hypothetical protein [Streptomyces sp. ME08-AFT2]MDX3312178.1 hypothetical protein [Streptomyces sp. ME08-AFT2]
MGDGAGAAASTHEVYKMNMRESAALGNGSITWQRFHRSATVPSLGNGFPSDARPGSGV